MAIKAQEAGCALFANLESLVSGFFNSAFANLDSRVSNLVFTGIQDPASRIRFFFYQFPASDISNPFSSLFVLIHTADSKQTLTHLQITHCIHTHHVTRNTFLSYYAS